MDSTAYIAEALRLYCSGVTSRAFLEREMQAWDADTLAEKRQRLPIIDLEADRDGIWRTRAAPGWVG